MLSQRRILLVAALVLLGGGWYLAATRSDSARIERALKAAAAAADPGRRRSALMELLAPEAAFSLSGGQRLEGRQRIVERALAAGKDLRVSLDGLEVRAEGDLAWARGELSTSDSQPGDLHRARYRLELELRQRGGRWQVVGGHLGEKSHEAPEARP